MRLIDADALPKWTGYALSATEIAIEVEHAPTIDAVPVVRCKDCRWHIDEEPGMVYCRAIVGGWVHNDWFCKSGERRDDETD
jgi:hypothetical protein